MIVLGIVLLIIGFIFKVATIWTLGILVVFVCVILALLGFAGREKRRPTPLLVNRPNGGA
jgi:hypothetical protein